jgi:hypothetical protein
MGKHVALPSDPVAKAAEKRCRFAEYRREWQKRHRKAARDHKIAVAVARHRARRELEQAARRLNIDLCLELADLTVEQLAKNIATAERWIAEM